MSDDMRSPADAPTLWATVALAFLPSFVALGVAAAFPLNWASGQIPLAIAVLFLAPLVAALMERRAGDRIGLAGQEFTRRKRAVTAFWCALLIVIPLVVRHGARSGGAWLPSALAPSIALSVALLLLALSIATAQEQIWRQLHPQFWELHARSGGIDQTDTSEMGRIDRGAIAHALWRWWVTGAVLMAGGLAAAELAPAGGSSLAAPWGVIGLVAYCAIGLATIGYAAQLRWGTQWRLEELRVAPAVRRRWGRNVALPLVVALVGGGLLLALGALQGAHTLVVWGWGIVLPLINALLAFFARLGNAQPPHLNNIFQQPPTRSPARLPSIRPQSGRPAGIWLWLSSHWLLLIVALSVAIGALLWSRRTSPRQRGFWRALLLDLVRELRTLWLLLWYPARRTAARAMETATAGARRAVGRRSGHSRGEGNLTPRQTVIALYLSVLAAAARRGHARPEAQTPREYADLMASAVPDTDGDLRAMTDLFMRARYDATPVGTEQRTRAQRLWRSLRGALRRARRPPRR
jgi:hypothetical protein